jgi:alkylation response protein AidB-like acyl-CoA dehydrogenase
MLDRSETNRGIGAIYGMSAEHEALRALTRDFMVKEVEPLVVELQQYPGKHFPELFPAMGAIGLLGTFFPTEYGGGGGDLFTRAIVAEETARVDPGLDASMFADIALFARAISRHGTHEQKQRYLAPVLAGNAIGGMGITEPSGGSDALSPKTRAVKSGGGWVINGSKTFITNAPLADFLVILTRTSGQDRQSRGGTWFIVERGMAGLQTGPAFDKMGWRSSPTGEVFLSDVTVDDSQVLGEPECGFQYLFDSLDTERALVGASTLGIATACLEEALRFAQQRVVFRAAISSYQLIQEKLASIATGIEATRAMLYSVIARIEAGQKVTREAAILKLYATEMASRAASDAVQILGGAGIMADSKVSRLYRDAKIHEIGAGSNEIIKQLIARQMLNGAR